jgi:hypothetical protein
MATPEDLFGRRVVAAIASLVEILNVAPLVRSFFSSAAVG